MSLNLLISNLKTALSLPSTTIAPTDSINHAQMFASAVDGYVKTMQDPAFRPPLATVSSIMVPIIVPVGAAPGAGVAAADALKTATMYASAISAYAAAIVISPMPIMIPGLGGIVLPPGKVTTAKLTDLGIFTSIQNSFKSIFMAPSLGVTDLDIQMKATMMANAIKTAFSTMTLVTISGMDSFVPVPVPFMIVGPLKGL